MDPDPSPWRGPVHGVDDDEELPQRPQREFPRLRLVLGPPTKAVLLLVVVVGIAVTLARGGSGHHDAAPTTVPTHPAPTVVPSSAGPTIRAYATSTLDEVLGAPAEPCPDGVTCATVHALPGGAIAAVAAAYPGARIETSETVRIGTAGAAFRWVRAQSGQIEIDVRVSALRIGGDIVSHTGLEQGELVRAHGVQGRWQVDVAVLEAPSNRPSDAAALRLARDPALVQQL